MYEEDDLLPISALQHLAFCERQCALIHLEGCWSENRLTVEGSALHDRAHRSEEETRRDVHVARGVALRSLPLGLAGIADVVEFHRLAEDDKPSAGVKLPDRRGRWRVYPVEYKRGRPKRTRCDKIQLCAQALCLEEMLGGHVPEGALFYARTKRRFVVHLDEMLRRQTEEAAHRLHDLVSSRETAKATPGKHCRNCSLVDWCLPSVTTRLSASRYLEDVLSDENRGERP